MTISGSDCHSERCRVLIPLQTLVIKRENNQRKTEVQKEGGWVGATGRQIHGSLHKDRQVTLLLMTSSSPDTFSSLIGDSFRGAEKEREGRNEKVKRCECKKEKKKEVNRERDEKEHLIFPSADH